MPEVREDPYYKLSNPYKGCGYRFLNDPILKCHIQEAMKADRKHDETFDYAPSGGLRGRKATPKTKGMQAFLMCIWNLFAKILHFLKIVFVCGYRTKFNRAVKKIEAADRLAHEAEVKEAEELEKGSAASIVQSAFRNFKARNLVKQEAKAQIQNASNVQEERRRLSNEKGGLTQTKERLLIQIRQVNAESDFQLSQLQEASTKAKEELVETQSALSENRSSILKEKLAYEESVREKNFELLERLSQQAEVEKPSALDCSDSSIPALKAALECHQLTLAGFEERISKNSQDSAKIIEEKCAYEESVKDRQFILLEHFIQAHDKGCAAEKASLKAALEKPISNPTKRKTDLELHKEMLADFEARIKKSDQALEEGEQNLRTNAEQLLEGTEVVSAKAAAEREPIEKQIQNLGLREQWIEQRIGQIDKELEQYRQEVTVMAERFAAAYEGRELPKLEVAGDYGNLAASPENGQAVQVGGVALAKKETVKFQLLEKMGVHVDVRLQEVFGLLLSHFDEEVVESFNFDREKKTYEISIKQSLKMYSPSEAEVWSIKNASGKEVKLSQPRWKTDNDAPKGVVVSFGDNDSKKITGKWEEGTEKSKFDARLYFDKGMAAVYLHNVKWNHLPIKFMQIRGDQVGMGVQAPVVGLQVGERSLFNYKRNWGPEGRAVEDRKILHDDDAIKALRAKKESTTA